MTVHVQRSCFLRGGFQPFSSRGTFETLLRVWRTLDTQNGDNLRILTEPSE